MQQTETTTTVQTGPTTVQTDDTTVQAGPTEVQTEQTTLHDFTLGLLTDLDAREAFQQDPLGALEAAGLSDITAGDVHDILPLVLDAASVANVVSVDEVLGTAGDLDASECLKLVTDNVQGVTGVADIASPSALTALVSDFSGLGDVSSTLDSAVLTGTGVVSGVTDIAADNAVLGTVTDVAGADVPAVTGTVDVLVKDLDTDVLVKDVVDADVLVKNTDVLVKDVADVTDVVDVTGNVVQDVAQVGDVHNDLGQVIGDVKVAGLEVLDGGVGNGNDIDIHF